MSRSRRGVASPQLAFTATETLSSRPFPARSSSCSRTTVIHHRPQQRSLAAPRTAPRILDPTRKQQTQLDSYFSTKQRLVASSSQHPSTPRTVDSRLHRSLPPGLDQQARIRDGGNHAKRSGTCVPDSQGPSLLGKAPAARLKTQSQFAQQSQIDPGDDGGEEHDYYERAMKMIAAQKMRRTTSPSSSSGRGRPSDPPVEVIPSAARSVAAPAVVRPIKSPRRSAPASRVAPVEIESSGEDENLSQRSARQLIVRSSPETPWLHEELSALPWEEDAALKAAQYRTSAGLQPTAKDLEARSAVMRRKAQQAHRQAILRSAGIRPEDVEGFELADPAASPEASPARPPKRPATPTKDRQQTASKRAALAPRDAPNTPPPATAAKERARKATPSQRSSQEESGDEHEGPRIEPLSGFPSPRTGRKIYAPETQTDRALPSPSEFRAQLNRLGHRAGIGPSTATPTPAVRRSLLEPRAQTSASSSSDEDAVGCKGREAQRTAEPQSPKRHSTSRPNLGDSLCSAKKLQRSPRKQREVLCASPSLSPSSAGARARYRADSSSPTAPSASETQLIAGDFDDEVDDTVLAMPVTGRSAQGADLVNDEDTQPLPFDGEDQEATQLLPFEDGSETEEEEISLAPRRTLAVPARSNARRRPPSQSEGETTTPTFKNVAAAWDWDAEDRPSHQRPETKSAQQKKAAPPQTTLGRFGFDESTVTPRSSGSQRTVKGRERAVEIPAHFKDHPLSRDVVEDLSDDEHDDSGFVKAKDPTKTPTTKRLPLHSPSPMHGSDGGNSSQSTQPLEGGSVSSHTEDEEIIPNHLLAGKLTAWPCSATRAHGPHDGMGMRRSSDDAVSSASSTEWIPRMDSQSDAFLNRLPGCG